MAIHEVLVRRLFIVEERFMLAVRIDADDARLVSRMSGGAKRELAIQMEAKDRTLAFIQTAIEEGSWDKYPLHREVLVAGPPEVGRVVIDFLTDEEIARERALETERADSGVSARWPNRLRWLSR